MTELTMLYFLTVSASTAVRASLRATSVSGVDPHTLRGIYINPRKGRDYATSRLCTFVRASVRSNHHHRHHLDVLSRVMSTTMDFQTAWYCVYFSNSFGDIHSAMRLKTLLRYFNLSLLLAARVTSILPVRHKFSKPCLLITCPITLINV